MFQIENPRAEEALGKLGIELEEGQVLLTRKILVGMSINKINGETCTVGQMKAVASCLLDIHGQHEHQSRFIRINSWRFWMHMVKMKSIRSKKK